MIDEKQIDEWILQNYRTDMSMNVMISNYDDVSRLLHLAKAGFLVEVEE